MQALYRAACQRGGHHIRVASELGYDLTFTTKHTDRALRPTKIPHVIGRRRARNTGRQSGVRQRRNFSGSRPVIVANRRSRGHVRNADDSAGLRRRLYERHVIEWLF